MKPRWIACVIGLALAIGAAWLAPRLTQPPDRFSTAMFLLSEGRPGEALHLLDDPAWRGVAEYRAGRYNRALAEFIAEETVDNFYNLGNAYARLHEWRGAQSAYRKALSLDPAHADSLHNLDVVERAEQAEKDLIAAQRETRRIGRWMDGDREDDAGASDEGGEKIEPGDSTEGELRASLERSSTPGQSDQAGLLGDQALSADPQGGRGAGSADQDPENDLTGGSGSARVLSESAQDAEILLRQITDNPERVLRARLRAIDRARRAAEGS